MTQPLRGLRRTVTVSGVNSTFLTLQEETAVPRRTVAERRMNRFRLRFIGYCFTCFFAKVAGKERNHFPTLCGNGFILYKSGMTPESDGPEILFLDGRQGKAVGRRRGLEVRQFRDFDHLQAGGMGGRLCNLRL